MDRTPTPQKKRPLPLVYSCSGCSNIAQLANRIALDLDREKRAEMSCIAGVGGGVSSLVKKAQSGRDIIALDGCHLHCVKSCLANQGVEATRHYTLTNFGVKKQYGVNFDEGDLTAVKENILNDIRIQLTNV